MSKIVETEVPPAFTANELAYQLEIKKLRKEVHDQNYLHAKITDYEEFVEELKQNVENLKKATTIKDEAYHELLGKYQKLESNPPRQTSQLEEAIILIPLIQAMVSDIKKLKNRIFIRDEEPEFMETHMQRWLNNHMDKIIIDEICNGGWFDEKVQEVVEEMTFELSDPTVEISI